MDPFEDDPFASGMADPLAVSGSAHRTPAGVAQADDFGMDFGAPPDPSAADPFGFGGDAFGDTIDVLGRAAGGAGHIASDFVLPEGFGGDSDSEGEREGGGGSVPPRSAEPGTPGFEALPVEEQLRVVIQAGLLPSHTTLQEYLSATGKSAQPSPAQPAAQQRAPTAGGGFLDDFVGGTGTFDGEGVAGGTTADVEAAVRIQSAARGRMVRKAASTREEEISSTHARAQAEADAAAVRIQAAVRGRLARLTVAPPPPTFLAADEFGFDAPKPPPSQGAAGGQFGFDDFEATTPLSPAPVLALHAAGAHPSSVRRAASGAVSSPTSPLGVDAFGFDDVHARVAVPTPSSAVPRVGAPPSAPPAPLDDDFSFKAPPPARSTGSVGKAGPVSRTLAQDDDFGFDVTPPPRQSAGGAGVTFVDFAAPPTLPALPAPSTVPSSRPPLGPASASAASSSASSGGGGTTPGARAPVASVPRTPALQRGSSSVGTSGESFEDFGFGTPTRAAPPPHETPVSLPPILAPSPPAPAPLLGPSVSAATEASLLSRPPLRAPAAPLLTSASISSLTLSWAGVEGADGYYLDVEPRSRVGTEEATVSAGQWVGAGARAIVGGSSLVPSTTATLTGLMKDSVYVGRVIAVRRLPCTLPNGVRVEAMETSSPGPVSGPLRTLKSGAEIARLTTDNTALSALAATIPGITSALGEATGKLETAKGDIVRLTSALNGKIADLNAANSDVARLRSLVSERDTIIAHETSEALRLGGELEDTQEELGAARNRVAALSKDVADRDASLAAGGAREATLASTLAAREGEVGTLRSKQADTEAHLKQERAARADLASRYDKAATQLKSVGGDKDSIIQKLSEDVGTVMEELARVQKQLHVAQDHVALIQPAADVVLDVRRRQAAWEAEHSSIQAGSHPAVGGNPLAKLSAMRKLGPRPTHTL